MARARLFAALFLLPTAVFAQRVTVMVEMQSPPAIESYLQAAAPNPSGSRLRAATNAARLQIAALRSEQQSMVSRLTAVDGNAHVLYAVQRVFNGVAVDIDAANVPNIAKLPGVKRVVPLHLATIDNTSSVPLIGAPAVWKAAANRATGKDVRVGVIDTGIDYIHRDFGGLADYGNRTTTTSNVPWTDKVVGGIDLAGDNYDASSSDAATRTPVPDPDPMDCNGHGSHVGGTIAGYGVLKDGTTYRGTYDAIDESQFAIGPGVAPEAKLYAIRIFGCSGATALVTQALEWAIDPNGDGDFSDHLDVVNLSLGSPFGGATDPDTLAANNLARIGTVVVASAGNSGDTNYVTGSPASGDRVISVASSVDALEPADGLQIDAPSGLAGVYVAHHAVYYDWMKLGAGASGTVVYPPSQHSGCGGFDAANGAAIKGKIAFLDWTDNECTSTERVLAAYTAGAIGVVFRYPRPVLDITIAGATTIPSTIVPSDTGDAMLANLDTGVSVTLTGDLLGSQQVLTPANVDTLSGFTARGPRVSDNALKPEITAPGQSIYSVRALSGFRGVSLSGTSMAAPHVTGVIALMKQLHPTWTTEELKALVMNTAHHDLYLAPSHAGARYAVTRIGAGRVDAFGASRANAVAFAAGGSGLVSASFGAFDVVTPTTRDRQISIKNKSGNPITYTLSFDAVTPQPGVSFSFPSGLSVTVPANGFTTFPVRISANPASMRHARDASLTALQDGVTRAWLPEASGYIVLTADGNETLRVPVLAIPRIASAMHTVERTLPPAASMTLHLDGTTVATGTSTIEDENAVVSAFELVAQEVPNPERDPEQQIRYAGITTNYARSRSVADAFVYFAVVTQGAWSSPLTMPIRIDIDTRNNGVWDRKVFLGDLATYINATGTRSDVFLSIACTHDNQECVRRPANGVDASVLDTVPFNTNVLVLPVRAGDLGLRDGASKFTYRVVVGSGLLAVSTTALKFDVAAPGLSFSSPATLPFGFADKPGNTISMAFDANGFVNDGAQGVLLLHHHNASGTHEETVTIGNTAKHRAAAK